MKCALLIVLALAGCNKDGILLVTVTSPSAPLTLARLSCNATDGTFNDPFSLELGGPFTIDPPKTFAFEVPSGLAGLYTISCDGFDGQNALLASGTVSSTITDSSRPTATMVLHGCGNAGARLCDSFEGTSVSGDWTQSHTGGAVSLDDGKAHRGSSSLHFQAFGGNTATVEIERATFFSGSFDNGVYVRFFAWLDPDPAWQVNATIASAYSSSSDFQLRIGPDRSWIFAGDGLWSEQLQKSATAPTGRWACIEWTLLAPDGGPNGTRLRSLTVDGTTDVDTLKGLPAGGLDGFWLGSQWDGMNQGAADLWIDDLIVDDKPVGCDK